MTFDCSVPLTWADIVNVVSTLVALGAVIVAIVANCKASQSLKYSLKMQEQSKNIDLFEKRVAVLNEIKQKNETQESLLQLLFNDKVVEAYHSVQTYVLEKDSLEHDLYVYERTLLTSDNQGGFRSPLAELHQLEQQLEASGYPAQKVAEFDELCKKHEIFYSETQKPEDAKLYNYKDLTQKIGKVSHLLDIQKYNLLCYMQDFIKESISPITQK